MEPGVIQTQFKSGLGWGAGAGIGLLGIVFSGLLLADVLHRFQAGDLVSSDQINANFLRLDDQLTEHSVRMPPVGSVIAWHKDLSGAPALPEGWVECNGGTVNDSRSPLKGQAIPNLNGERRFLRGGSTSGSLENHAFQNHSHSISKDGRVIEWYRVNPGGGGGTNNVPGGPDDLNLYGSGSTLYSVGWVNWGNAESDTRPINMSVIWIMRIK